MGKERILLINPGYRSRYITYFPLGLGYMAGACDKEGIEVELRDVNVSNLDGQYILDTIRKKDFHVVGIGGFSTQLRSTIELSNLIKNNYKDVTVIVGGIQVFGCEQFILNNSKTDIICVGESEITLPRLVHAIYKDKDLSGIPSIIYRRQGEIVRNEGFFLVANLDEISFPKYDVFQMESYIKGNYHSMPGRRTIDFICSRGCPYKCNYCINSSKPVKLRSRSPENILGEIEFLKKKYSINDFSFADEIFEIDKKKALEICETVKGEDITWLTSCRPDRIDDEMLSAMKGAGCRMLLIGFESGSQRILNSMNKKVNVKTYSNTIKLLRKHDMQFYANFMIGMPEESEETVKETERFCMDNGLIFGPAYVTPFPGTKLYEESRHKILDEKKYLYSLGEMDFVKEPIINLTEMSMEKLVSLRNRTVINTVAHIVHNKLAFVPMFLIEAACSCYLFIFNMKNLFLSRILRFITKIVYKVFTQGR